MVNEFGDYQTPPKLVLKVLKNVKQLGFDYEHIIEPTFGVGNFIHYIPSVFTNTKSISGLEINSRYYKQALKGLTNDIHYDLHNADFFAYDITQLFDKSTRNLVIGNLPWITASQLSELESKNIPKKSNIKGLKGYDALTGKANFDIAEYMCLSLLNIMQNLPNKSTLAVLVKNIVAKNIVRSLPNSSIHPSSFKIFDFDAKAEFQVAADACLMIISFKEPKLFKNQVDEYSLYNPNHPLKKFGWYNQKFVSNISNYKKYSIYDSKTNWNWRSGVKHDASKVMELRPVNHKEWINGLKEKYSISDLDGRYIYPLVKSSDVRKQLIHTTFRKAVIVTQKYPKEDTSHIATDSPSIWNYLTSHEFYFNKRKSSIYKNAPRFSMFGIGDYSFKKYKVAISGMYKDSIFTILPPFDDKPVMVDDTVYFVGFDTMNDAKVFCSALNSNLSQKLLKSLVFKDEKRPYKKDILERIDVISIIKNSSVKELNASTNLKITESDILHFLKRYDSDPKVKQEALLN